MCQGISMGLEPGSAGAEPPIDSSRGDLYPGPPMSPKTDPARTRNAWSGARGALKKDALLAPEKQFPSIWNDR